MEEEKIGPVVVSVGDGADVKSGYKTSEFVLAATSLTAGVVVLLATLGVIAQSDQENVSKAVTGVVVSLGAALTSGISVWKYIQSRTEIKATAMELRAGVEETPNAGYEGEAEGG